MSAPQQASAFNNQIPPRYTIKNITAAYTVTGADYGSILNCSGATSFTVSLTAAATLGSGFNVWVWNNTTTAAMTVTIDPNSTETIDGRTTLVLNQGEGTQIVCDGTNWQTGNKKTMRAYAENASPTAIRPVASADKSISIGVGSSATGITSVAIGSGATSSNTASVAIGGYAFGASASAVASIAIGDATVASASYNTAIGANSGGTASQAVTGTGATALSGSYASGTDSFAAAVANNTSSYGAQGTSAIAIGRTAKASGNGAIAIGGYGGVIASGNGSIALGGGYNITGASAAVRNSVAIGDGASVPTTTGKYNLSADYPFVAGAAQYGVVVLLAATTGASATVLASDAAAASASNQLILPNNSAYTFSILVVARQQAAGGTASASWRIEGLIRREANAGTTTLVASTVTTISNVPAWTIAVTADTTNGGLAVTATGAAATNIRWVATAQTSEVTYA